MSNTYMYTKINIIPDHQIKEHQDDLENKYKGLERGHCIS